ncbi:MAG TPA: nucleoside 2-deoxyribosyltransferase [Solirubrobacteraceae bacterium]|nr:nucleoside 2-deoxyribosyltransferase [Solirubrobacteraceae bacterium]
MTVVPKKLKTGSPVYCSGPMFSVGDKWEQQAVAGALEKAGYTTYLPQRDGIEVGRIMQLVDHPLLRGAIGDKIIAEVRKWVFALDMYQLLERCRSLVFNLDGRTPDDGSVVETAAAFTAGKPIVIYKTSPITMLAGADNPMVEGLSSTWTYTAEVKDVPGALAKAIVATQPYAYSGPPHVASLMSEGERVWEVLEDMREPVDSPTQFLKWLLKFAEALFEHPVPAQ